MHVCKRASPELEPYITLRLTGRVLSAASQVCLERFRLRHLLTRLYHVTRMYVYMCVGTVYSIGSNSEFVLTRSSGSGSTAIIILYMFVRYRNHRTFSAKGVVVVDAV